MARTRKGETGTDAAAPDEDSAIETLLGDTAGEAAMPPEPEIEAMSREEPESAAAPAPEESRKPVEPTHRPEAVRRRSGFLPTVLGGAIAAGLGFGAATYVLPRFWMPQVPADEIATVRDGLVQQATRLDTLSKAMDAAAADTTGADLASAQAAFAEQTDTALADLRNGLSALDTRIAETGARLDDLDGRLSALEKRPAEGGAASATALDAFGREMEAFRADMAAQKAALAEAQAKVQAEAASAAETMKAAVAEADRLRTEAEETARAATARAALGRIQAALTAGGALDPALVDLTGAGVEVPPALAEQGQGVPTLEALRAAFPPAARDALAASLRETASGSLWDRTRAFLRTQSGARSLAPREGADPDAVLSRTEGALAAGDLEAAITEIGALPKDGQARMTEWVALANRRIAATSAAAALAAELK
ncbi:COG4223 family protein [Albidovulum sp.]|uniref:COG4223 family protein n=1 Tax=Albidovulum sp. TaxID=1872424 RepID=UPI0039B90468